MTRNCVRCNKPNQGTYQYCSLDCVTKMLSFPFEDYAKTGKCHHCGRICLDSFCSIGCIIEFKFKYDEN